MDARIDPAAAFGISLGDAHVIRNAGASAREALRSILISEQLLGTRESEYIVQKLSFIVFSGGGGFFSFFPSFPTIFPFSPRARQGKPTRRSSDGPGSLSSPKKILVLGGSSLLVEQ